MHHLPSARIGTRTLLKICLPSQGSQTAIPFPGLKSPRRLGTKDGTPRSNMPRLLVATKNAHKTGEIRDILGDGWEITDLTAHPAVPIPEETGATFEENARIKAEAASRVFPGLVLSDDSGLEVDALGGAPGVQSTRYAGAHGDDAANRARLKRELAACGKPEPWTARFRCAMALAEAGRTLGTFDGRVEGRIVGQELGTGGFGYDPLFVPEGFQETFGLEFAKRVLDFQQPFVVREHFLFLHGLRAAGGQVGVQQIPAVVLALPGDDRLLARPLQLPGLIHAAIEILVRLERLEPAPGGPARP